MNTKKRIIECFEAIAHGKLAINGGDGAVDLPAAQILVEPRLHALGQQVTQAHERHGIDEAMLDNLRAAESVSGFIVGVLCGFDLAARPDIVARFAELYAMEAEPTVDQLFAGRRWQ